MLLVTATVTLLLNDLLISMETEIDALDGEQKPLLALQESVPEQAASSCLEFPGMSVVSQSHHWIWGRMVRGREGGGRCW
jgi:hypothetical protein